MPELNRRAIVQRGYVWAALLSLLICQMCWCDGEHTGASETAFEPVQWGPVCLLRGQHRLIDVMADRLMDGASQDRQRAAFALGQIGGVAVEHVLFEALQDSDRQVRLHVALALAQCGRKEGYPGAAAAFYAGPEWVKYYAIYGMCRADRAACLRLLQQHPVSGSPFLSRIISQAQQYPPADWPPREPYGGLLEWCDWQLALEFAAEAMVAEADIWFHAGDYEQVIRCNEAALFLQPSWVDVYSNSGWLLWSMNRHGAAVEVYRKAIQANPDSWEAHFELGYYYLLQGHARLAIQYLKRAVDLDAPPIRARSYAHALERSGRLEEARDFWRQLEAVDDSGVVTNNLQRLEEILSTPGRR